MKAIYIYTWVKKTHVELLKRIATIGLTKTHSAHSAVLVMIFFPYGMRKQNHKSKFKKSKPKKGINSCFPFLPTECEQVEGHFSPLF